METTVPIPKFKQDTISNMTKDQNWQINQMVMPDQLHKLRPLTAKKSCREILTQTGKEIQQMNEILKRLLPEDDRHTIINQPTKIEVIPDCLMTFKIPCFLKSTPCKLFFTYLNQFCPSFNDMELLKNQKEKEKSSSCNLIKTIFSQIVRLK